MPALTFRFQSLIALLYCTCVCAIMSNTYSGLVLCAVGCPCSWSKLAESSYDEVDDSNTN